MYRRRLAVMIGIAGIAAAGIATLTWILQAEAARSLGASAGFERSLAEGCESGPDSIELWSELIPLTTVTIIELPGITSIASVGDVAFIGMRDGMVMQWSTTDPVTRPFVDLSGDTSTDSDQGLLNMIVTPDGGSLLVMRTTGSGDVALTAHSIESRSDDTFELLRVAQPDPRHNGGGLAFGPDGDLYIGIGDGGGQGDPLGVAGDAGDPLGSILRARLDLANRALAESSANGRPTSGSHELVWAIGVRNPFRIWFDDAGQLWVADVGERCREEVTVLDPSVSAPDLGWSAYEGTSLFEPDHLTSRAITQPVLEYGHERGACAVVGGTQYEGDIIELEGAQVIADICTGHLFAITDGRARQLPVKLEAPVDVTIGPDGELWVTDMLVGVRRITRAPVRG